MKGHRVHQGRHQASASLDHHDEVVSKPVHARDVVLAEIPAVQNEPDVPVAIALRLVEHVLQLRDVDDAAWILLVEQRLLVALVEGKRVVEQREPGVVLGLAELDDL